jgi:hypothetical protein
MVATFFNSIKQAPSSPFSKITKFMVSIQHGDKKGAILLKSSRFIDGYSSKKFYGKKTYSRA